MSDLEGKFRQGMAMLKDPKSVEEWRSAIEAIDSAALGGFGPALERRSLFECMGVGRQPDWERALDSLVAGAEKGCKRAAQQLVLLAEDRFEADPGLCEWTALRSQIRIADRLRPRRGHTLSPNPLIRTIEGIASPAECRWLIEAARPRLERAIVYSNTTGEQRIDPGRTNEFAQFALVDLDLIVEMIRARISATIGAPLPCLEVSQVLRYQIGEEFAPHCDFLDPKAHGPELAKRGQRAATLLIYLNHDFKGGETSFEELKIEHRGQTGDALLFSNLDPSGNPEPRTKHWGRPPTSGEKWVFSQWVRDRLPA